MKIYLQNDPLWKNEKIVHKKYNMTIERNGCLICSLSSIMGIKPKQLNTLMIEKKIYRSDIISGYSTVTQYMAGHNILSIYDLVDWNKFDRLFGIHISRIKNYSADISIGSYRVFSDSIYGRKKLMTVERFFVLDKHIDGKILSYDTHNGEKSIRYENQFYDFLEVKCN